MFRHQNALEVLPTGMLTSLLGVPADTLDTLKTFLSNDEPATATTGTSWKSVYRDIDATIVFITKVASKSGQLCLKSF